ncbi:PREDICTED: uncharacterized protein LOC106299593 isoform X1 [Brassica oleracea var. oleracea]|uniref:uncharacterized protein LOC106299593 isoform X1 n=1 Tax=Brassica oleracea var. oleracea TaxID=109376 RepID=UPI0006A73B94|nr:PREDICTED: uncharacterized protein LOC106299593 isoform X1 [Brassica oleracea var. oleracea]
MKEAGGEEWLRRYEQRGDGLRLILKSNLCVPQDSFRITPRLSRKLQNGSVDQAWRTDGFNTYQWLKPSSGLLLKDVCRVEADVCIHGITSANKRTTIATQVNHNSMVF